MRSALTAILLLCTPFLAQAQEREALAIVEKAVQAHGGVAGIKRLRVARVTYKLNGTFSFPGLSGDADVTVEETYQLPRQIKKVIAGRAGIWRGVLTWAIDGDTWWDQQIISGNPEHRSPVKVHEQKSNVEGMYRPYMVVEFLADYQKFRWSMASGDGKQANHLEAVLAQSNQTGAEITFYFNKETGLLANISTRRALQPANKEIFQEEEYDGYKEFDGVRLPIRQVVQHDGKKFAEVHVTDVRFFEKLDDSVFAPPDSGIWQLVVASLLGLVCCFFGGWALGKLQGRMRFPAIRLALTSAIFWGLGGCPLGPVIFFGLQQLGYPSAASSPGVVGIWMAFGGAFAGFAGGWVSGRQLPVGGDSSHDTFAVPEQCRESTAERPNEFSLGAEDEDGAG